MSRLEMFLRDLKLTPKQAKRGGKGGRSGRGRKKEDVKERSITESREKKKKQIEAQRRRIEAQSRRIEAQRRPENYESTDEIMVPDEEVYYDYDVPNEGIAEEVYYDYDVPNEGIANEGIAEEVYYDYDVPNEGIAEDLMEEQSASRKADTNANIQNNFQSFNDRAENIILNVMDIGVPVAQLINGEEVIVQSEVDLGCNEVDDNEEEDDNQDNEICKIKFNVRQGGVFNSDDFTNAKNNNFDNLLRDRITNLLNMGIKRIGTTRRSSRNQGYIKSRIFDTVHGLYGEGKLKAEVQNNTSFQGQDNQDSVITIYKASNLVEKIANTFNEYVYDNDTHVNLSETDILIILLYGVEKTFKYKVEFPKPKLKRVAVGGNNSDKFKNAVECYNNINREQMRCGLYSQLTLLYTYLNTAQNKDVLNRSVILWFDTHHDFKEDRYKKAEGIWNEAFGQSFIEWYSSKFFQLKPSNNNLGQYSFSDQAITNTNVLTPVIQFSNTFANINGIPDPTAIPTLLRKISYEYLQNKDFEKKMLLHYIVHNFNVPTNNSIGLLRDILYVDRTTYNNLLNGISTDSRNTYNNNEPQDTKVKKLKGIALKLKQLNNFYRDDYTPNILNTNNDANTITNTITNTINTMITTNPTFIFTGTLPSFTSNPNNNTYVRDAGKSDYPLGENVQYVPAALFDANGSNTYEPNNENNTEYDNFISKRQTVVDPNIPSHYNTDNGVPHLGNIYKYRRNGCNLEVSQVGQVNIVLTKAYIRCKKPQQIQDFQTPDDAIYISYLKKYLIQKLRPIVPDDTFTLRMYEVLLKFVPGNNNQFAVQRNGTLSLPKYFNSIKTGPGVQDLVFLTILYRLEGKDNLQLIDNIVNLKRVGDYGQVIDAKMANLPFFTIDSMESLMCIIEKVSCYIDFNQGVIIYDNNGGGNNGGFIRSKALNTPGYGRRP